MFLLILIDCLDEFLIDFVSWMYFQFRNFIQVLNYAYLIEAVG